MQHHRGRVRGDDEDERAAEQRAAAEEAGAEQAAGDREEPEQGRRA